MDKSIKDQLARTRLMEEEHQQLLTNMGIAVVASPVGSIVQRVFGDQLKQ